MSFAPLVGSQFGYQKKVIIPTFPENPSSTDFITVASVGLASGLWIVNVNSIEFACDDYPTGKMNNMRQQIVYDGVIRDRASIIGTAIYGCELSSIAVIKTDGVTPVLIQLQGQTTDASTFTIDSGFATFTRLY
jgi:hypothetical protein